MSFQVTGPSNSQEKDLNNTKAMAFKDQQFDVMDYITEDAEKQYRSSTQGSLSLDKENMRVADGMSMSNHNVYSWDREDKEHFMGDN